MSNSDVLQGVCIFAYMCIAGFIFIASVHELDLWFPEGFFVPLGLFFLLAFVLGCGLLGLFRILDRISK